MDAERIEHLKELDAKKDYTELIKEVAKAVKEDKRIFTSDFIKQWCARRYRNIFLSEAVNDQVALKAATKLFKDNRSDKQKIAERYMKGDELREWQEEMPASEALDKIENTTLFFAPGMLTGMLPVRAFQTPFPQVARKKNIRILQADVHPMRGCEANLDDLVAALEKGYGHDEKGELISKEDAVPPGDVFMIGYSKGAPDIMNLLVKRPDLAKRIRCFFSWAGALGGSYLGDDIYESIKDKDLPTSEDIVASLLLAVFPVINEKGLLRRFDEFDIKAAIKDIAIENREAFWEEHKETLMAMDIPVFNITGSTTVLDVPYFQVQGVLTLNRYDANNDMQVTQAKSKLNMPMATDLAMFNAHHWDMSYDPFPKTMRFGSKHLDHPFPKEAAMMAIVQVAVELGLID